MKIVFILAKGVSVMSSRTQYKTKQREALFTYFASIPGQHFTVNDVCAYFHAQGYPIGMTTVYRQLDRMVDEGLVNKYIIDANTPAAMNISAKPPTVRRRPAFTANARNAVRSSICIARSLKAFRHI